MIDIVERLRVPVMFSYNPEAINAERREAANSVESLRVLLRATEDERDRQRSGLSEARADLLACAEVFDELDNPKGYNLAVGAAGQIERSFSSDDRGGAA